MGNKVVVISYSSVLPQPGYLLFRGVASAFSSVGVLVELCPSEGRNTKHFAFMDQDAESAQRQGQMIAWRTAVLLRKYQAFSSSEGGIIWLPF